MNPTRLLVAFAPFALASALSAQTLVQYVFGSGTSGSLAASSPGANVVTSSLVRGSGTGASTTYSTTVGSPTAPSLFITGALIDEAISASSNDYVGFTIAPTSGNALHLSSLSFSYAFSYNSGTAPGGPATFELRSSLDNYGSAIASFSQSVPAMNTVTWATASVGLSATTYQNLSGVTFRIYLNDGDNTSGTSYLRLDTIVLSGVSAAPVPEPSAAAGLAGLGALGLVAARRRRR